ncbi:MAG: DNA-processing protein DprA [Actinobacteria bacterium]|nr:DNA-protecting protein DprA [Acidobacteriota bacterium]MCZ6518692.1 DNA-processing protein DprA [Actinomycetota bacterium]MCZ6740266.1 DNA-processing protein DprA [Actinomycetota bacterium]
MTLGHRLIKKTSAEYPVGLGDLEDPPSLFVEGKLGEMPGVAVVGTRRCTRYGIDLAEAFGVAIARSGWTTVSGLARGIDAAAHRGCLRDGGHAVAVLGSGIDVCYPEENRPILDEILAEGGAVVSEYPPGTPPDRWRFPARNRIIAAMSSAVVVVEAAKTGGALITARLAAEIGRPVFVVPGDVDRPASEGCNLLIRDGANPVLGAADLIEELSLSLGPPVRDMVRESEADLPPGGVALDDLSAHWSVTMSEALVRVGKLQLEGRVRRQGEMIVPT